MKTRLCNIQIFLALKNENFQWKILVIFLIFAQNIDCGYKLEPPRQGGSNEYPQSMFWSKNKKNSYIPLHIPAFLYKSGVRGFILYGHVFLMHGQCSFMVREPVKKFCHSLYFSVSVITE